MSATLLAYLDARGLSDGFEGPVEVVDLSSSHQLRLVRSAGQALVVKDAERPVGPRRRLGREYAFYQLASRRPELQHAVPRCRWIDPARGRLVIDAVVPGTPTPIPMAGEDCDAVATALAAIHGIELRAVDRFPHDLPWIFTLLDEQGWVPEGARRPFASPVRRRDLAPILAAAKEAWCRESLIHGDLRAENCLRRVDGDERTVQIIDWETAAVGDQLWDLACLLADHWTRSVDPHGQVVDCVDRFAAAFDLTARRIERLDVYTRARIAQSAIEFESMGSPPTVVDGLVELAIYAGSLVGSVPARAGATC